MIGTAREQLLHDIGGRGIVTKETAIQIVTPSPHLQKQCPIAAEGIGQKTPGWVNFAQRVVNTAPARHAGGRAARKGVISESTSYFAAQKTTHSTGASHRYCFCHTNVAVGERVCGVLAHRFAAVRALGKRKRPDCIFNHQEPVCHEQGWGRQRGVQSCGAIGRPTNCAPFCPEESHRLGESWSCAFGDLGLGSLVCGLNVAGGVSQTGRGGRMVGSQGRRWGMVFCRAAALQPHGLGEDHRATCERQAAGDDAATDADRHGRDLVVSKRKWAAVPGVYTMARRAEWGGLWPWPTPATPDSGETSTSCTT